MELQSLENFCLRENGSHVDTADTVPVGDGDSDVSLFTPSRSPGVLDDPILFAGALFDAVPYEKHSMIQVGLANIDIVDDATLVLEPGVVTSSHTD